MTRHEHDPSDSDSPHEVETSSLGEGGPSPGRVEIVGAASVDLADRDMQSNTAEPPPSELRIACVGANPDELLRLQGMLGDSVSPRVEVVALTLAETTPEMLGRAKWHAAFVFVGPGRDHAVRVLQMCGRRADCVPMICIGELGDASRRADIRNHFREAGAREHLFLHELTPALLELALSSALEWAKMQRERDAMAARFALAVRGANDGLWEWDLQHNGAFFSRRWKELLGYETHAIGSSVTEWFARVHPNDLPRLRADIDAHVDGRKSFHELEHRVRASGGEYVWVLSRGVVQRDADGKALRMAGSLTDTSAYRRREQELRAQSRQDALTELPRREPFMERLARAVELAKAFEECAFVVLLVEVNRFRMLNASIGRKLGDTVLSQLARRLQQCVGPEQLLARFDGPRFAVLIENVSDASEGTHLADRIHHAMQQPFDVEAQSVYVSVSIGMTSSAHGYEAPDDVITDASTAATHAKELPQGRNEIFNTRMRIEAQTMLRLEMGLRKAVEHDEFSLYYQPVIAMDDGRLLGFEALIRWQHPRRGIVQPTEFIPVAENTGMIVPIGRWAVHEAIGQLRAWHREFPHHQHVSVALNLSGRQVADGGLLGEIERALRDTGLDPHTLEVELTESVLMENAELVQELLRSLRAMGVRILVDDFGTGYSSLSYLHRFPVDGLKIDKSFVDRLDGTPNSAAMVKTIVDLALNLGIETIAEGIETQVQADQLRRLGCVAAQGYLFGRPLTATDVRRMLALTPANGAPVDDDDPRDPGSRSAV